MIYVFIGPPGSGKGTQSALLANRLNLPHIATGNIIRDAIGQSSVLGVKAKSFVEKGDLLPDADVINIIKERVAQRDCANGFIMDGFPRTSAQAKATDKVIMEMGKEITKVIALEIPEEILMQRLSGRRVCRRCGTNYHLTFTPT
ncbi:MAG: nucleoside monophosphate kinase, partial [Planctomycetes bacterium]|nr:nucleoside monophosphate kinase [Planctomycetota bacterium]